MRQLKKLTDFKQYFKSVDGKMIFTGKELKVLIPKKYEEQKLLFIEDVITTLAILRLEINDMFYSNIMILAKIDIIPSVVSSVTIDGEDYLELTLKDGDVFINNTVIIKTGELLYKIFVSFLALGKIPKFISYKDIHSLFDGDFKYCGLKLRVNRIIFELIYAHMHRDPDNLTTFYRHTTMLKNPAVIALHQIAYGPESHMTKITGSYMKEGIVSSLVNDPPPGAVYEVENILRS